jgi:hypothetical protein
MGIFNRRNAVLGWSVWKIGKRAGKSKARRAAPSVEGGKPNKSALAIALAGLAGSLMFWRRRRSSGPS